MCLFDAIGLVKAAWAIPEAKPRANPIRDNLEGRIYWDLAWLVNGELAVVALVDADAGTIRLLRDFRRIGYKDNLGNIKKAIEIATLLLDSLGANITQLSSPEVSVRKEPSTS